MNTTTNGAKKNMYSLIRFSTDAQQWGTSMARQIGRARDEAVRRGWSFDESLTLQDLGVSAFRGNNFDRKYALGKFIDASKQGLLLPNPCLCVENLDRFSRDILDNADQELWSLVKRGVDVLILSNGLHLTKGDENDVSKRAIVLFEFDRSGKESQRKSDLVNAAFTAKYKLASDGQKVALGNWLPKWVTFYGPKKGVGKFKLNDKSEVIVDIVESYLAGKSMVAIASALRKNKTPCISTHGKKWSQGHVRHILTSEALIGQLTVKGQVFKNYLPAVISQKQWDDLQVILKQNTARKGGIKLAGGHIANLFRNRVFCSACNGSVKSNSSTGRDKYFYRCSNVQHDECNVRSMLPIRLVEEDFFVGYLNTTPGTLIRSKDETLNNEINSVKSKLADAQKKLVQLEQDYTESPSSIVAKVLAATETSVKTLTDDLTALESKRSSGVNAPGVTKDIKKILSGGNPVEDWQHLTAHIKQSLTKDDHRSKLLHLLPNLVDRIDLDLANRKYRVITPSGTKSDWRKL